MKVIYIAIISISLITIIMLALAFLYLDWQQHQTFLYALYQDGALSGYEKVDSYLLENRRIYKSFTELPRDILNRKIARKIVFGMRGKNLVDYKKDVLSNSARSCMYIVNGPEKISFMATGHADFSYLDNVPSLGNDIPFEIDAIVTYPLIIRRYNFKKRGEQFVNILIPVTTFFPPANQIVSIISMGKEAVEVVGREINCEHLIFKLKNGDFISVWINQILHNVIMVEAPQHGFKATLCTKKENLPVEEYKRKSDLYTEREVIFTNEGIVLYGTLSIPVVGTGPFPAAMLIWDNGPMDRNNLGIFTDLAHALAEAGFCVLRFDKRGVGQSQGYFLAYDQSEEISDLKCALNFLKSQSEVDNSRIALLGYSEGGFYAAHLASSDKDIKACIIMSAASSSSPLKNNFNNAKRIIKRMVPDNDKYLENAVASIAQGRELIKNKSDWVTVLGERVFTRKINFEREYNMLNAIAQVKVPVLILHGGKDNINFADEAKELGDALAKAGNNNFTIIYLGELDHFFGTVITKPPLKDHIEVVPEVLKSLAVWLDEHLLQVPIELPAAPIAIDESMGVGAEEKPPFENKKAILPEIPISAGTGEKTENTLSAEPNKNTPE